MGKIQTRGGIMNKLLIKNKKNFSTISIKCLKSVKITKTTKDYLKHKFKLTMILDKKYKNYLTTKRKQTQCILKNHKVY